MRIRVLSDLHLEHQGMAVPPVECDAVILAGDIHVGLRGVAWAAQAFSVPVLYVPGNHEYYGEAIPRWTEKLREAARGTCVKVLDCEKVVISGVRFLGATLWTDFELGGDLERAMATAASRMTDFRRIRVSPRFGKLRPAHTRTEHLLAREWLEGELATPAEPTVVITHHAPSPRSLPEAFARDSLSPAYASSMQGLVLRHSIALWVHGHIHSPSDYNIGGTRVVCNPRGYGPDELVEGFERDLVIEMPDGSRGD